MVGQAVAPHGGQHPQADADASTAIDHRDHRQLGGRGHVLAPGRARTGVVRLLRLAEIAVQQIAEVAEVLDGQRLVEPVVLAERRDRRRVELRASGPGWRGGIAGDQLRQGERDERDPDATAAPARRAGGRRTARATGTARSAAPVAARAAPLAGADGADVKQPREVQDGVRQVLAGDDRLRRAGTSGKNGPSCVEPLLDLPVQRRARPVGARSSAFLPSALERRVATRSSSSPAARRCRPAGTPGSRSGPGSPGPSTTAIIWFLPARVLPSGTRSPAGRWRLTVMPTSAEVRLASSAPACAKSMPLIVSPAGRSA